MAYSNENKLRLIMDLQDVIEDIRSGKNYRILFLCDKDNKILGSGNCIGHELGELFAQAAVLNPDIAQAMECALSVVSSFNKQNK